MIDYTSSLCFALEGKMYGYAEKLLLASFLVIVGMVGCGSKSDDIRQSDSGAPDSGTCPSANPEGSACSRNFTQCKIVRSYCPQNPMGPDYYYENYIFEYTKGIWHLNGQDCYDCCRFPIDGVT